MSLRPTKGIKRKKGNNHQGPLLAPAITQGSNRPLIASTIPSNRQNQVLPAVAAENPSSAFIAFKTDRQEVILGTTARVLFTSESLDINEEYNTATGEFIPQQTGLYSLFASVDFTPTTPGVPYYVSLNIFRSGALSASVFDESATGHTFLSVSRLIQLQAGDRIHVGVSSTVPGTINPFSVRNVVRFEGFQIQ